MIGIDNYPITLMSGKACADKDSKILKDLEDICTKNNIDYDTCFADSSDHASFINNGFDSLTFSHCDTSNIHTPNDTSEKISADAIKSAYDIINIEITDYAYNDIFIIFYKNSTLIFFAILTFILITYKAVNKKAA